MRQGMFRRMPILLFILWLATVTLHAQTSSTFHVFPQFVDGDAGDGSAYLSLIFITNLSGSSTSCTFSTISALSSRLALPPTQTIPSGYMLFNITPGHGAPLMTAYATVSCARAVQASIMYAHEDSRGNTLGMATVFSAPNSTYASMPVLTGVGMRNGIAIA